MRLLKPVDYKLKVHQIISTSSMLECQLRNTINLALELLVAISSSIMEAEVFDRSAELSIVTGSNLDPEK